MIKLSRKYVKVNLELPVEVAKEKLETPEAEYSFLELFSLIENSKLYIENKRKRSRPSHKKTKIIGRDGYSCAECGSTEDLELHHIVPVSLGGSDEDSNLQLLCKVCHHRRHKTHV